MNVFAESKTPEIDALNYTFFPIYVDPLLSNFGPQQLLLDWCKDEFIYNRTTGIISSQSCPNCVVILNNFARFLHKSYFLMFDVFSVTLMLLNYFHNFSVPF